MKRFLSTNSRWVEKLVASVLLTGLLVSSIAAFGGSTSANSSEVEPPSASIDSRATPFRSYALTNVRGQSTAVEVSKQIRVKHPLSHGGLALKESAAPTANERGFIVASDQSVLYLSFRVSPTGGRAPPPLV